MRITWRDLGVPRARFYRFLRGFVTRSETPLYTRVRSASRNRAMRVTWRNGGTDDFEAGPWDRLETRSGGFAEFWMGHSWPQHTQIPISGKTAYAGTGGEGARQEEGRQGQGRNKQGGREEDKQREKRQCN